MSYRKNIIPGKIVMLGMNKEQSKKGGPKLKWLDKNINKWTWHHHNSQVTWHRWERTKTVQRCHQKSDVTWRNKVTRWYKDQSKVDRIQYLQLLNLNGLLHFNSQQAYLIEHHLELSTSLWSIQPFCNYHPQEDYAFTCCLDYHCLQSSILSKLRHACVTKSELDILCKKIIDSTTYNTW